MTLRLDQILIDGDAECSYLREDDTMHTCAVMDPRPDVDIFIETAHRFGMAITHVFETDIHADFLSGARMEARFTIGYERRFNSYATVDVLDTFKGAELNDAPPVPTHYPRMKKVNAKGPEVLRNLPCIPPMTVTEFSEDGENGAQLLDLRDIMGFAADHVRDSLNIGLRPELSVWVDWLLNPDRPLYLVTGDDAEVDDALRLLWHTGFTDIRNVPGSWKAWKAAGHVAEKESE